MALQARSGLGSGCHGPLSIRLGFALKTVGPIGDCQPVAVVGARDGALTLLDDVRQFVGEGVLVAAAFADDDVVAAGVGAGADFGGGGFGSAVIVDADVREVGAEPVLHVGAGGLVEGAPAGAEDVVDRGSPLHGGWCLFGLLVAAAGVVLVLFPGPGVAGLAEHLHDGCVARAPLQPGGQSLR